MENDKLVRLSDVERWILTESACIDTPADRDAVVERMRYSIPAVGAVEKRHGAWVVSSTEHTFSDGTKARWNIWKCSRCPYVRTAGWEYTTEGQKPKARFCENCGARMDGRREDGDNVCSD